MKSKKFIRTILIIMGGGVLSLFLLILAVCFFQVTPPQKQVVDIIKENVSAEEDEITVNSSEGVFSQKELELIIEKLLSAETENETKAPDPLIVGFQSTISVEKVPDMKVSVAKEKKNISPSEKTGQPAQGTKRPKETGQSEKSSACQGPSVAVKPVAHILAKGRSFLKALEEGKELPEIHGDFAKLGFRAYMKAVLKSGGRLVIYDCSGTYGFIPLVELDSGMREKTANIDAGYYVERPRFLKPPYLMEIAHVLSRLKNRDFPKGDLRPAFVLPRQTECFILGALCEVLGEISVYEYICGEYRKDSEGKLVFTVNQGKKWDDSAVKKLQKPVEICFGLVT